VNNAGWSRMETLQKMSFDDIDGMIKPNFIALTFMTKVFFE
jgi:short-subunit dehydrogenase